MTERTDHDSTAAHRCAVTVGLAVLVFIATACGGTQSSSGSKEPTFDFEIPAGAGDRIEAGEPLEILPAELIAELDDTIQIVNRDDRAHLVGPWFVDAGETLRQRFNVAGVFDGSCSVHTTGGFTVIVNETGDRASEAT